jgi:hypothetical protein
MTTVFIIKCHWLNTIEVIWSQVKMNVAKKKMFHLNYDVITLANHELDSVTQKGNSGKNAVAELKKKAIACYFEQFFNSIFHYCVLPEYIKKKRIENHF